MLCVPRVRGDSVTLGSSCTMKVWSNTHSILLHCHWDASHSLSLCNCVLTDGDLQNVPGMDQS